MTRRATVREVIQYSNDIKRGLREQPVRLRDIRARMASLEAFAGDTLLQRSLVGEVFNIVIYYYPLPECIALYRRKKAVYREHLASGVLDGSSDKNVLILDAYGLCSLWLAPNERYPYGDARLLRPILGEVLIEMAGWQHVPYADEAARLGEWYEELGPGGALYPSEQHLAYVQRFEAFAEDIVWDSRGREHLTIVNFPAPPGAVLHDEWWSTRHAFTGGAAM